MRAQILTPWAINGLGQYDAKVFMDHRPSECVDATDQPVANIVPAPNLFLANVICDVATLAAIEADGQYYILTSEV